jgi:hypothetical protein
LRTPKLESSSSGYGASLTMSTFRALSIGWCNLARVLFSLHRVKAGERPC